LTDIVPLYDGNNCSIFTVTATGAKFSKCIYRGTGTGQHCAAAPNSPTTPTTPTTPPQGPTNTTTTAPPQTTNTPAPTSGPLPPPGTVSTESSVVNSDGSVTTTTTTVVTAPDGSKTTTVQGKTTKKDGTGLGGTGNGTGTGEGDGEGSGGECDPTSTDYLQCLAGEGSDYGDFGNGDKSMHSVADTFYTGVSQTAVGQLANSISGGVPSGTCPVVHFDMFGRSFTMDFWCQIYEQNGSVISTVAHGAWVLMGLVIILGA
jgi:hypothetical protein